MPEQGFTNFERTKRHRKPILKDPATYFALAAAIILRAAIHPAPVQQKVVSCKNDTVKTEVNMRTQFQHTMENFREAILVTFGDQKKPALKQSHTLSAHEAHYTP